MEQRCCLSVKDFGAQGDGVTHDEYAIQAALYYGSNNSSTIYFPPGTYIINNQITIFSNTGIVGAGENRTILKLADSCAISVPSTQGPFPFALNVAANAKYITLSNFTFDGNRAHNPGNSLNGSRCD